MDCTCFVTPPETWFVHYGAVEPGSALEPNPECPVHFPQSPTPAPRDIVVASSTGDLPCN